MCCHWHQGNEIPEHIRVLQMSLRIPLLCVDEAWKQDWIPDEEDWSIVPNKIPISILSVKFNCKSSWISTKKNVKYL